MNIKVEKPTPEKLLSLGVGKWPIWEKEKSNFDWYYDQQEVCYFLEGNVEIEIPSGSKVSIQKGDLAIFPEGLSCKWNIKNKVKKHYKFGK